MIRQSVVYGLARSVVVPNEARGFGFIEMSDSDCWRASVVSVVSALIVICGDCGELQVDSDG